MYRIVMSDCGLAPLVSVEYAAAFLTSLALITILSDTRTAKPAHFLSAFA